MPHLLSLRIAVTWPGPHQFQDQPGADFVGSLTITNHKTEGNAGCPAAGLMLASPHIMILSHPRPATGQSPDPKLALCQISQVTNGEQLPQKLKVTVREMCGNNHKNNQV